MFWHVSNSEAFQFLKLWKRSIKISKMLTLCIFLLLPTTLAGCGTIPTEVTSFVYELQGSMLEKSLIKINTPESEKVSLATMEALVEPCGYVPSVSQNDTHFTLFKDCICYHDTSPDIPPMPKDTTPTNTAFANTASFSNSRIDLYISGPESNTTCIINALQHQFCPPDEAATIFVYVVFGILGLFVLFCIGDKLLTYCKNSTCTCPNREDENYELMPI